MWTSCMKFLKVENMYCTDHQLLRYIHRLQAKVLSFYHTMIPLEPWTMKFNATVEMMAITWPNFSDIHIAQDFKTALRFQTHAYLLTPNNIQLAQIIPEERAYFLQVCKAKLLICKGQFDERPYLITVCLFVLTHTVTLVMTFMPITLQTPYRFPSIFH